MGRNCGLAWRGFERAVSEAPGLLEPAEPQTGATQRMVDHTVHNEPPRRLRLEELLALLESVQRFVRLTELRQYPSGRGDRPGKMDDDTPCPGRRDPVLDEGAR